MRWYLLFLSTIFSFSLQAQIPHDQCENARELSLGEYLPSEDNQQATVTETETPEPRPASCIQTFENDLWYKVYTIPGYRFYKASITPLSCNTPAGLQALVIEGSSCESGDFIYRACVNPHAEQALNLIWEDSVAGNPYLIYVDGYDGTECVFSVKVEGFEEDPRSVRDVENLEVDYDEPTEIYEAANPEILFTNNEAVISWDAKTNEDVKLFLVERVMNFGKRKTGYVAGKVKPSSTVGLGGNQRYEFADQRPYTSDKEYCYRIVRVNSQGKKAYSEPLCVTARMNEDFYISPVFPTQNQNTYVIRYRNEKKQDLTYVLLDEKEEELKRYVRKKEPKGEGSITIDMSPYTPGIYFLKVQGKDESFLRKFTFE
ncbi:MAG: hypothetical protein AAFR61_04510 [Bacteroidota bacterium]